MEGRISIGKNRFFGLVLLGLIVVGIAGVVAYGTSTPSVFGHSVGEIDWSQTIQGQVKSSGGLCIGSNCVNSWESTGGGSGCAREFCVRDGYFDSYTEPYFDYDMNTWVDTRIWYSWRCISNGETLNLGEAPSSYGNDKRQQIVKCKDDSFLYSPSNIFHVQHTAKSCTDAGGTVVILGANKICQFSNPANPAYSPFNYCPSGWLQYQNLSETGTRTCVGTNHDGCTGATNCSLTAWHGWGNSAPEFCYYRDSYRADWGCSYSGLLCTNLTKVGCY